MEDFDDGLGAEAGAEVVFTALGQSAFNAGMGVCITYAEFHAPEEVRLLYASASLPGLVGYTMQELMERSALEFCAPESLPELVDLQLRRLRGEDVPPVFQAVALHRDGHRIPVEISTTPVDLHGRAANVSFVFDISHRKNAEDALRRSEQRFRSLIENAPDGITILRWPTIVFVNPRAARLLGFNSPKEAIGKNILTLLRPVEAMIADERVGLLKRGERLSAPTEYASHDPDGNELTVEISSIPIEYEGAPAVLGFARDVTERKAMLAKLMEADKLAAVGTLAAGVAHEINNPLAYLLLNLEFFARELPELVDDPERLEQLQLRLHETRQGAERVKTIVRDLQTLTRRDEGIRAPVELEHVIESALNLSGHEIRQRAQIIKHIEPVPEIYANATRLEQLFLNLLINAAHAVDGLDPQRNRIEISVRRSGASNAVIAVRDNGVGMPPEVLRRVFDPFFTTKPTGVGTGLGLPICLGIVRALDGEIHLTSEVGVGTTATITLPLHRLATVQPVTAPMPRENRHTGRILVIDDERAVAESLAAALREEHVVVSVGSAREARGLFQLGQHFDVALCDLLMPEESGMQLFEHVQRERPELASRFIFMTGGAFLPEAERFLSRITNPRIDKPFEVAAVRRLVDQMLERGRSTQ